MSFDLESYMESRSLPEEARSMLREQMKHAVREVSRMAGFLGIPEIIATNKIVTLSRLVLFSLVGRVESLFHP
jgi:hypothetical protein